MQKHATPKKEEQSENRMISQMTCNDTSQCKSMMPPPMQFHTAKDTNPRQLFPTNDGRGVDRFQIPAQLKASSSPSGETTVQRKSSSNGLPTAVQAKMENSMGHDFSSVNVHQNSKSATDVGALAYAQGNNVHFAPGQFKPDTRSGQELIGHELAHVVQQREGRVKPTKMLGKGMAVNDDPALEREADRMGKKAAHHNSKSSQLKKKSADSNTKPLQLSSSCENGCGCNKCTTQLKVATIQRSTHDRGCGCGDCRTLQLKENKTIQRQADGGGGIMASLKERIIEDAKLKSAGWDVKKVQETLNELCFECGKADGVLGKQTTAAIKAFQRKANIDDDGIAGKNTKAQLYLAVTLKRNKEKYAEKEAPKDKGPKTFMDGTWFDNTWAESGWNSSATAIEEGLSGASSTIDDISNSVSKHTGDLIDYLNPFGGSEKAGEKDASAEAATKTKKSNSKDPYLKYLEENDYKTYKKDLEGNDKTFTVHTDKNKKGVREKAYLRTMTENKDGTRTFKSTSETIPLATVVKITDVQIDNTISRKTFAKVTDEKTGKELGWTSTTNFKGKLNGELMGVTKGNIDSREPGQCTIFDPKAYIRKEIDGKEGKVYESSKDLVAKGTYVKVTKSIDKAQLKSSKGNLSTGSVVKIKKVTKEGDKYVEGADLGWTAASNLVDGYQTVEGQKTKSLTSMWVGGQYAGQTDIVDMVTSSGRRQIAKNGGVALPILKLFKDAGEAGINLSLNSGYRDYNKQNVLKKDAIKRGSANSAATAGCSKHQGGKAYDLNNKRSPKAYEWLKKNSYKYGIVQNLPCYAKEGHHWLYAPSLAKSGYYTYFGNGYTPFAGSEPKSNQKLKFGTGKGQVDPRVKSTEDWMTGGGSKQGKFRITKSGKKVALRIN